MIVILFDKELKQNIEYINIDDVQIKENIIILRKEDGKNTFLEEKYRLNRVKEGE